MSSLYLLHEHALLVQGEIHITFKGCLEKSRPFAHLFVKDADG